MFGKCGKMSHPFSSIFIRFLAEFTGRTGPPFGGVSSFSCAGRWAHGLVDNAPRLEHVLICVDLDSLVGCLTIVFVLFLHGLSEYRYMMVYVFKLTFQI